MAQTEHTIFIHPLAPAKVPVGAACNGCGVCCLFAPCPLGMLLSRRRTGACEALRWNAATTQYRCGAIVAPQEVLNQSLPHALRGLGPALAPALRLLGRRWIAVGNGCDSTLESEPPVSAWPHGEVTKADLSTMPASDLQNDTTVHTVARHTPP